MNEPTDLEAIARETAFAIYNGVHLKLKDYQHGILSALQKAVEPLRQQLAQRDAEIGRLSQVAWERDAELFRREGFCNQARAERDALAAQVEALKQELSEARQRFPVTMATLDKALKWTVRTPTDPKTLTTLKVHGPETGGANTEALSPSTESEGK